MSEERAPPEEAHVVRQGYLRRLKTMKRKYFVLKSESRENSARLEYYESDKKFRARAPPKRAIPLKTCFNINRRLDTKHKHVIALYTKEESFCVVLESEEELRAWLNALLSLHGEEGSDELQHPTQHVWSVNVQRKGLGASKHILGPYHLCLTDKTISLVKIKSNNNVLYDSYVPDLLEFSLKNIRRCGDSESFFYMEMGRLTVTGAGELWMLTDDSNIAQSMHTTILGAMSNCSKENCDKDLQPTLRDRSMSADEATKPTTWRHDRRQTHTGVKTGLSPSNEKRLCSGGMCVTSCIKPCVTSSASYCVDPPANTSAPNTPKPVSIKGSSNNASPVVPAESGAEEGGAPSAPRVSHARTRSLPLAGDADDSRAPVDRADHRSVANGGDSLCRARQAAPPAPPPAPAPAPAAAWLTRRASTGCRLAKWSPAHAKNTSVGVRNRCDSMPSRACPRDTDAERAPSRVPSQHLEDLGEVGGADEVDSAEWTPAAHRTPRIPEEPDTAPYCEMSASAAPRRYTSTHPAHATSTRPHTCHDEVGGADEVDSVEWTPAAHRTPRIPEEPDTAPYCEMSASAAPRRYTSTHPAHATSTRPHTCHDEVGGADEVDSAEWTPAAHRTPRIPEEPDTAPYCEMSASAAPRRYTSTHPAHAPSTRPHTSCHDEVGGADEVDSAEWTPAAHRTPRIPEEPDTAPYCEMSASAAPRRYTSTHPAHATSTRPHTCHDEVGGADEVDSAEWTPAAHRTPRIPEEPDTAPYCEMSASAAPRRYTSTHPAHAPSTRPHTSCHDEVGGADEVDSAEWTPAAHRTPRIPEEPDTAPYCEMSASAAPRRYTSTHPAHAPSTRPHTSCHDEVGGADEVDSAEWTPAAHRTPRIPEEPDTAPYCEMSASAAPRRYTSTHPAHAPSTRPHTSCHDEVGGADEVDSAEWTPAAHRTPRIPEEPDTAPYCEMSASAAPRRIPMKISSTHHSRNSSLAEDSSPQDRYLVMVPNQDTGYVDMHGRRAASPAASGSSVASGTPSTDLRFSEYHLDPATSKILVEDDERPIPRAYSVGSRPAPAPLVRTPLGDASRTRAFSVGSKSKMRPLGPPPPPHASAAAAAAAGKTSSAPLLAPNSSDTLCDDLMELDFSSNQSPRTRAPALVPSVARTPPVAGFVAPLAYSRPKPTHTKDEYVDMSPSTPKGSGYVEMRPTERGLTPTSEPASLARSPPTGPSATPDGYVEMNYGKRTSPSRPILIFSNSTRPITNSGSRNSMTDSERSTPSVMSPQIYGRNGVINNNSRMKKMTDRQRRNSKDAGTPINAQTIFPFTLESPASPAKPFEMEKTELEAADVFECESSHYADIVGGNMLSTVREISEEGTRKSQESSPGCDYVTLKAGGAAAAAASRPIAARGKLGSQAEEDAALLSSNPTATKTMARESESAPRADDARPALVRAPSGPGGAARFAPLGPHDADDPPRKSSSPKPVESALNRALRAEAPPPPPPLIYASLDLEPRGAVPPPPPSPAPTSRAYTQIDFARSDQLNTVDSN